MFDPFVRYCLRYFERSACRDPRRERRAVRNQLAGFLCIDRVDDLWADRRGRRFSRPFDECIVRCAYPPLFPSKPCQCGNEGEGVDDTRGPDSRRRTALRPDRGDEHANSKVRKIWNRQGRRPKTKLQLCELTELRCFSRTIPALLEMRFQVRRLTFGSFARPVEMHQSPCSSAVHALTSFMSNSSARILRILPRAYDRFALTLEDEIPMALATS